MGVVSMEKEVERDVLIIGIMTGTSVDGIDVALVRFKRGPFVPEGMTVERYAEQPYPEELRARVLAAMQHGSSESVCQLHVEVARALVDAVKVTVKPEQLSLVSAIAAHGQTIFHIPGQNTTRGWRVPSTLQVCDASVLMTGTGVPIVVNDFRRADMAVGGQGGVFRFQVVVVGFLLSE